MSIPNKRLKNAKEKEREKKRKEKERERKKRKNYELRLKRKRERYKPIHIKNLRKKQNARAYAKIRTARIASHKAKGDNYNYYKIVLTKDYEQTKMLTSAWWLLTAYEKFYKLIEENHKGVICEKRIIQSDVANAKPFKTEILLLKKIDPNVDNGIRHIRNKEGIFVENKIITNKNYAIIAKDDWYIPETYNVYGYNPITDRKTGRWIYDNIINKDCCKDNIKIVFMCFNKLIIQYNTDLDFVICKNSDECLRLYNGLQQATPQSNKYVFYTSYIPKNRKSWLYDKLEEKTGWNRNAIKKTVG